MANVLNIENLYVSFDTYAGEVQAVRGVSYFVKRVRYWLSSVNRAAERVLPHKRS